MVGAFEYVSTSYYSVVAPQSVCAEGERECVTDMAVLLYYSSTLLHILIYFGACKMF